MRKHSLRLIIVAFVVAATACCATAATASSWTVLAQPASKGMAQSVALSPPATVTLSCVSPTSKALTASWAAVPYAASYDLYYSTVSATSGFSLGASGITATSWTSTSLGANTYWVQVAATVTSNWKTGNSVASNSRKIQNGGTNCI